MQLAETIHIATGLVPVADRYNTNPAGDVVDMGKFTDFMALLDEGAGGTGTVKITVEACDDFVPTNVVQIPFLYRVCTTGDTWGAITAAAVAATGYTTVAGANKKIAIFVRAADLPEGYSKLRVQLTEVANSPCDAGLVYILSGNRYGKAIVDTAIA